MEDFKIFCTTNRTMYDAQRAIENGSFAVEASDWDSFIEDEGWEGYPTLQEMKSGGLMEDLELVKYKGREYILVIIH